MIKNYLTIAFRNLLRQKAYSSVNILGLATGMACCILIALFIVDELGYDRWHPNADRMVRLTFEATINGQPNRSPLVAYPAGPTLKADFPEVESFTRVLGFQLINEKPLVRYEDRRFNEDRFLFADENFFETFQFPLKAGEPDKALAEPNSVVMSEAAAEKYFGSENPVGKILRVGDRWDLKVTGIVARNDLRSHMQFDFVGSLASIHDRFLPSTDFEDNWEINWFWTYLTLKTPSAQAGLESKLGTFVEKYYPESLKKNQLRHSLQPIEDIHLYSRFDDFDVSLNGDGRYILIFGSIAVVVLLIACMNYMNLSTARAAKRAGEIGMRKVLGAERGELVRQFLGESVLTALLACMLAFLLVEFAMPVFNALSGKKLALFSGEFTGWAFMTLGLGTVVGLLAGSYPALYLSSFQPIKILKGKWKGSAADLFLRKTLVVVQFGISITLIVGTMVVERQLNYIQERKLGFDKDRLVILPIRSTAIQNQIPAFKDQLTAHSAVESVSLSAIEIGEWAYSWFFQVEGLPETQLLAMNAVDNDFVRAMGLRVVEGRDYIKGNRADSTGFIINESAVRFFGWERPIGKSLTMQEPGIGRGPVIGVVEDFHYEPLHKPISPMVLFITNLPPSNLVVRLSGSDTRGAIAHLEEVWNRFEQNRPFSYAFVDQKLDSLYRSEQKLSDMFVYFSGLAIFIACLGLLALVSFMAEQRIKEIGIRKVLGATERQLMFLLTKQLLTLVILANGLAWPVAFYLMNRWLEGFAYRISLDLTTFTGAGLVTLAVAIMTVVWQAYRASAANPVKALKYE